MQDATPKKPSQFPIVILVLMHTRGLSRRYNLGDITCNLGFGLSLTRRLIRFLEMSWTQQGNKPVEASYEEIHFSVELSHLFGHHSHLFGHHSHLFRHHSHLFRHHSHSAVNLRQCGLRSRSSWWSCSWHLPRVRRQRRHTLKKRKHDLLRKPQNWIYYVLIT